LPVSTKPTLKNKVCWVLPFVNKDDYNKIQEDDVIDILGLTTFAPGKNLTIQLTHKDGSKETFEVAHTYNQQQIEWFKAGGALNIIRKQAAGK
jgi:aconitate hydratase